MDFLMSNVFLKVDILLLVFVRFLGLFVTSPVFGGRNVPNYSKIGFSLIISTLLLSVKQNITVSYDNHVIGYALLIMKELIIGMLLGFVVYLILSVFYLAGQLIDYQIGFTMVSVMDPLSQIQVPVTGNFYYLLVLILFLIRNGHHKLIQALFYSYDVLPIGEAVFTNQLTGSYIHIVANSFVIAFKIASPFITVVLILDVALAVLARTVPQLNMFVVGLPLRLLLGLACLFIVASLLSSIFSYVSNELFSELFKVIKGLIP
ncbi:MAG: flagellar type III secretion system protein FliR [Epulopiscium sp.]|nr:flagellar type III secretion system protein FliR [Candidatus Epulonipiscium sp.]HOQ17111.1 flagellar biosynthetic protein FliR [Defluviitaleaceae bacterium]HPT75243.1 flagellar biosynthetic protein FliR [Defluviitaleaceae bacterium]